jgi:hypothetical protein
MENMEDRLRLQIMNLFVELCSQKNWDDMDGYEEIYQFFVDKDILKWIDMEIFAQNNPAYHSRLKVFTRDLKLTELLK